MTPIFQLPEGLSLVNHFCVPAVQTWGLPQRDREFKETIRQISGVNLETAQGYAWFVFVIRCQIASTRTLWAKQIPDIENIPKLIVDAFTGLLYPDDNILYVRGVQIEGEVNQNGENATEVWIFGMPALHGEQYAL
jgi:Holliday junction resolvase RusA-like endonuclease